MKNLTEKAILVTLNISAWSARKYDKTATQEVNDNHNSTDAGRFNKLLIDKKKLEEINKISNEARSFHYENTLPWGDNGERLLPSQNYFEYTTGLSKYKNQFDATVTAFCNNYDVLIDEARVRLNGLFNLADYPNDIHSRFGMSSTFMPVPETDDLRIGLKASEVDALKDKIQQEINERFANATKNIYDRIKEQLERMYERLSTDKAVFRDSLFENLVSLVDLLPRLNVSGDERIIQLCADLKKLYIDPQVVRDDSLTRARKAQEVDAILKNMTGFLQPSTV